MPDLTLPHGLRCVVHIHYGRQRGGWLAIVMCIGLVGGALWMWYTYERGQCLRSAERAAAERAAAERDASKLGRINGPADAPHVATRTAPGAGSAGASYIAVSTTDDADAHGH
jgi:hypothetical protein